MLVKLVKFSADIVDAGPHINIDIYLKSLIGNNTYQVGDYQRDVYVDFEKSSQLYIGAVITKKTNKNYCSLDQNSNLVVNTTSDKLVEFNFFIYSVSKKRGLYSYHHGSLSPHGLNYIFGRGFNNLKNSKFNLEKQKITNITKPQEKAIREKYKGRIEFEMIVSKEGAQQLIESLKSVKQFSFISEQLTNKNRIFAPIKQYVNKERHEIAFTKNTASSFVSNYIASRFNSNEIDNVSILGIDEHGIERIIRLMNMPEQFGEYQYDDFTSKINQMNLHNIASSWAIKELISKSSLL